MSVKSKKFCNFLMLSLFLLFNAINWLNHSVLGVENSEIFGKRFFVTKDELANSWVGDLKGIKVRFGNNLSWYIAGRLKNSGTDVSDFDLATSTQKGDAIVLYLAKGIDNIKFNAEMYDSNPENPMWMRPQGEEGAGTAVNSWIESDIRNYLSHQFENAYLTPYEKSLVLPSQIKTNAFENETKTERTSQEHFYLPSGSWNTSYLSWGAVDISGIIPEGGTSSDIQSAADNHKYLIPTEFFAKGNANGSLLSTWTRSAHSSAKQAALAASQSLIFAFAKNVDGSMSDEKWIGIEPDHTIPSCAPICRLNIEDVLFATPVSIFSANGEITAIPQNSDLFLKHKAGENDFSGHNISVINGQKLTFSSEANADQNCYLCAILKGKDGKNYSMAYPLSSGATYELDLSTYDGGYYWFEKEAENAERKLVAAEPTLLETLQNNPNLDVPKTGNNIFAVLTLLISALVISGYLYLKLKSKDQTFNF